MGNFINYLSLVRGMAERCPLCSANIHEGSSFCAKCGFKINEDVPKEAERREEKHTYNYERTGGASNLSMPHFSKKIAIGLVIVLIAAAVAGAFVTGKVSLKEIKFPSFAKAASENKSSVVAKAEVKKENNTSTVVAPVPAENKTVEAPVTPQISLQETLTDYLKAHAPSTFQTLSSRIIEVAAEGNKTFVRFRTSTTNPAQESLYLLGVTFLAIPSAQIANATGYNEEGKIIQTPDSRTQSTRTKYWRQYHAKTEWFGNISIPPECKVDADCEDKNMCTKDQCTKDGFCSNVIVVSSECPGLS